MADYRQTSFSGGLNLLLDDTRLPVSFKYKEGDTPYDITYNQYRLGVNTRTRFDVCSPINSSVEDKLAPQGIKQAILTFGNYVILFVSGTAWYKLNGTTGWTQINGFLMSKTAPRYWTCAIPLTTTNYGRLANPVSSTILVPSASGGINQIQTNQIAGTFGNNPGLLVQDGVSQPRFIYINSNGSVQCKITQTYNEWTYTIDSSYKVTVDKREYVPIGTFMEWYNGILFIIDTQFQYIYRSVSGRPLDFVVNVDMNGQKGGDATTTSYSVGVSGITAMRAMPGNSLFVAAGGASAFLVTLNQTPNAPTIFGEYTFNRQILFNANCITERGIIDISGSPSSSNAGDTVFIDANGLRSFNAILALQNEGRNSIFSATVSGLFIGITNSTTITSSTGYGWASAITFDNYAIFSVNTVYGYVLVVYDTINNVYQSIDTAQIGNHAVKQFAAITISTLALYAITDDDRVVQLYISDKFDSPTVRLGAVSAQDPKKELKVTNVRVIFSNIETDASYTCSLFVNNRLSQVAIAKLGYQAPTDPYVGIPIGIDIDTQTNSIIFSFPNSAQGWKAFAVLSWTGTASLVTVSMTTEDLTPMQPLMTQAVVQQT
jgi:hypothetical protein